MTQLLTVVNNRRDEILSDAGQRLLQVTISRRSEGGWATYKTRILQADPENCTLIIEQPTGSAGQTPPELAPGETIGMTFRRGHKKCMCSVQIARLLSFSWEGHSVPAFEIPWPDKLQEMQRRVYYRAEVPKGRRIEAQFWDGGILGRSERELRDVPHHVGLLNDISVGGCSLHIEPNRDPQLHEGETVGILLQPDPKSAPLLLDAVFRHTENVPNGKVQLGFQFVGLEVTPEGRQLLQALSRVVSTFLRIEIRRKNRQLQRNPRRRKSKA